MSTYSFTNFCCLLCAYRKYIKYRYLKCTAWWIFTYAYTYLTTAQIKILNIFITLRSFLLPLSLKSLFWFLLPSSSLKHQIHEINLCLRICCFHSTHLWDSSLPAGVCVSGVVFIAMQLSYFPCMNIPYFIYLCSC